MIANKLKRKHVIILVSVVGLAVILGIATQLSKRTKWEETAVRIDLENSVKEIQSVEEIGDYRAKSDVMSAVRKGGDIVYTDSGVDYVIVTVDNTDKNIVAKEITENKSRNTLTLYWSLESKGNSAESGRETAVFEIKNDDRRAIKVEPMSMSSLDESQTLNVVAVGKGGNTKLINAETNKQLDADIVTWYGNGIYNIVIEGKDIKESSNTKVIEIEGKVVGLENMEGKITIDIGDSTKVEAINLGQPVLKEMIYNFQMYYTDKGFEVYPVEQMIKARVKG